MRELSYLNLTRFGRLLLDRTDRMSMAAGVEVRVPFCDHRLVDYIFNVPWSMKTAGGQEKSLLRAATSDLLPNSITEAHQSALPVHTGHRVRAGRAPRTRRDPRDSNAAITPLLNTERARERLNSDTASSSENFHRRDMENAIQLDRWLREYDVQLQLD